ncbi:MAG: N-formylglutamate deformylase [uncultured Rubrobacteraceae bacterium]|uniref:N-formylglutamate deformylase n=1 Tax=uncultured Rubrobacteraceae bacterium TaxID=349277 RepID=A0A6J4QQ90_9ACTN|nr:MAG: N-formylglutamate deformylase [uncultured Rubrobacteraceae bacterium]
MIVAAEGATVPEVTHRRVSVNGTELHYVSAGTEGSAVLLVHGFPETWWAFHKVIPRLAESHRVFAVDLRGFGDSGHGGGPQDNATLAEDLHQLIGRLDVGGVHLTGQDVSGPATFRLASEYPDQVRSYAAIETTLPGYGMEALADVARGGLWHVGVMAAPGIPELLIGGRERDFLARYAFPALSADPGAVTDADIEEFTRAYAQPAGFDGAGGVYRSMLREGEDIRALAKEPLAMPVLAVGALTGDFTAATMRQVATGVRAVHLEGVGHYVALEASDQLAEVLLGFYRDIDANV